MRDLYKQLGIDEQASDEAIRSAIGRADGSLAESALMILLDPRRRVVYDRNRRLLATIGQLRAHLGLNYTRLWARREFKDFWIDLSAAPAAARPLRRVDPMLIAGAFRAAGRPGRRHAARWGAWTITAVLLALLLLAFLTFWGLKRFGG